MSLQARHFPDVQSKWKELDEFNPAVSTWVVPDLRSKLEIQELLVQRHQGIPSDAVIRVKELWLRIFQRLSPESRIVSLDWVYLQAQNWLAEDDFFRHHPSLIRSTVDLLDSLAPIYLHESAQDFLQEFWTQFPDTQDRFEKLWNPTQKLVDQLRRNSLIVDRWIPFQLQNLDWTGQVPGLTTGWNFIFDLGASMTSPEAELIERLARVNDVQVFAPDKKWIEMAPFLFKPYSLFPFHKISARQTEAASQFQTRKFSGRLGEIKDCVSQVRSWLDQGIPLEKIAVISTTLETDLPVLKIYFDQEGIPVQAPAPGKAHSLPIVQQGLARLQIWGQEPRFTDLATSLSDHVPVRYEKFEASLKHILENQDFDRSQKVLSTVQTWRWKDSEVDRSEFYKQAQMRWPKEGQYFLNRLFEKVLETSPGGARLKLSTWIQWLQQIAAKIEISAPEKLTGPTLTVTSVRTSESPLWTHRYILNLVEGESSAERSLLSVEEINFLDSTFGMSLPHPEQTVERFEVEWLLSQPGVNCILGYPVTDWNGAPTTPHPEWVMRALDIKKVSSPGFTVWDSRQAQFQQKSGKTNSLIPPSQLSHLSVSGIEAFAKCPFIFAAGRRLFLEDLSEADVVLDPRQKGNLVHQVLEKVFTPDEQGVVNWEISDSQIESLIDQAKISQPELFVWDSVWPSLKKIFLFQVRGAIELEKLEQKQLPGRRVAGVEVGFEIYFSPELKEWSRDKRTEKSVLFKGRIDRIDRGPEGLLLVLDYKSSGKPKFKIEKWIQENNFQMGFYTWLVDQGLVGELSGMVVAGVYFDLKKLNKGQGFQAIEGLGKVTLENDPEGCSHESVKPVWAEIRQQIEESVDRIQAGEYLPNPKDQKDCEKCRWRGPCRAPHLGI